ncbi:glutathione binding-like protein [Limnobacter sp.]|uniref:glutathione binding-like protein n=1 Tax=Limnobacter sp. TaxID=2003368 RepID=UPI0035180EE0
MHQVDAPLKVHGLDLSYFTGKLEGYLRGKDIAYTLIEMDTADFKRCGKATGVLQMPQVEWTNGSWLTDTTLIIPYLENLHTDSSVLPNTPLMLFVAQFLEDFGDEWLWRPALAHRWANALDARLMGQRLALGMMRDVPLPTPLRRLVITTRQRMHFLWGDGFNRRTGQRILSQYTDCLAVLQPLFAAQPFVLGQRPSLADYGLFGSMFRHFFCDPTPAGIMRTQAPAVHEWVARMWNLRLSHFNAQPWPTGIAAECLPLLQLACEEFLPYMALNEEAWLASQKNFSFTNRGVSIAVPTQRYRAWRYQRLRTRYQALPEPVKSTLAEHLPTLGPWLGEAVKQAIPAVVQQLPVVPSHQQKSVSRTW